MQTLASKCAFVDTAKANWHAFRSHLNFSKGISSSVLQHNFSLTHTGRIMLLPVRAAQELEPGTSERPQVPATGPSQNECTETSSSGTSGVSASSLSSSTRRASPSASSLASVGDDKFNWTDFLTAIFQRSSVVF
ncbi:hypothetical protein Vretifemale_20160 [Volvox reticuliferus]|uniref:Uncharacterized protein n=1 Tax=Volvox reticuliferus TaxID=1737510 RepID=A0A8J4D4W0_9CHLO|nr:hypothetical protein Vretifemale_20160 [Volvox reticuliferus]